MKALSSVESFTVNKGEVEVHFTLTTEQNNSNLLIELIYRQSYERYNLKITNEYIRGQDNQFTLIVQTVKDLYDILLSDFDKLELTNDGQLLLELELIFKKKTYRKIYRFKAIKEDIYSIKHIMDAMECLRRQMKAQLQIKDDQINELKKQNKQIMERNVKYEANQETIINLLQQFKTESLKNKEKSNKLQNQLNQIKERMNRQNQEREIYIQNTQFSQKKINERIDSLLKRINDRNEQTKRIVQIQVRSQTYEELRQLRQISDKYAEGLAAVSRTVQNHEQQLIGIRRITQILQQRRLKLLSLQMHPENIHKDSFQLTQELNSLLIVKTSLDKWEKYISTSPLIENTINIFRLKRAKSKAKNILMGIGTNKAFDVVNAHCHRQTLCYYFANGYVYELQNYRAGGPAVSSGQTVTMRADLTAWKVDWLVNDKVAATTSISNTLRGQPLYLYIVMFNSGDEVQLQL